MTGTLQQPILFSTDPSMSQNDDLDDLPPPPPPRFRPRTHLPSANLTTFSPRKRPPTSTSLTSPFSKLNKSPKPLLSDMLQSTLTPDPSAKPDNNATDRTVDHTADGPADHAPTTAPTLQLDAASPNQNKKRLLQSLSPRDDNPTAKRIRTADDVALPPPVALPNPAPQSVKEIGNETGGSDAVMPASGEANRPPAADDKAIPAEQDAIAPVPSKSMEDESVAKEDDEIQPKETTATQSATQSQPSPKDEEDDETDDEKPLDLAAMNAFEYERVAQCDGDALRRYEQYRRSDLKNMKVKRILLALNPSLAKVNEPYIIAVKGLAKLFVGDVTETALKVKKERGDKGALQPVHLREAFRRLRNAGVFPSTNERSVSFL